MKILYVIAAFAALLLAACQSTEVETAAEDTGIVEEATPEPVVEEVVEEEEVIDLAQLFFEVGDTVNFEFDQFDLTPAAQSQLEAQAAFLREYSDVAVIIEGHCDERGTREYNLALGERRAESVAQFLVASGIDAGRITTISFGKESPLDPGHTEEAWRINRRGVTVLNIN